MPIKTSIHSLVEELKRHPRSSEMGMIACHLGMVRATSRNGAEVRWLEVQVDEERAKQIVEETRQEDGVIDVLLSYSQGRLEVGEPILAVAVGGDTREHVFPALIRCVERFKQEASHKREG